ncbi:hypothetical protein BN946_scf184838.g2 [Trametes cinnabarina]|uniref:Methyltransferase domain-containing protein n=1 Tax=Pycnoporus cinnabarinus TaxID=5643 RepID=A0A060SU51_PYCCI|nr:hypothetical protein BN946_scf184838.g2 [Trametes cinnabarina]
MSELPSLVTDSLKDSLSQQFPLDDKLYSLEGDELKFMQAQTGITDEEELKKHILKVQAEAYAVYPYPCIRLFRFIHFKLPKLLGYDRLLKLGEERPNAILLDLGCCFGNDVRRAAADGFPVKQIVASDLHAKYWDLGHKLFRTTTESFPAKFVSGDVFDPAHLAIVPPFYAPPADPLPDLSTLTSLNPLRGHVSAIHTSSFFHLFNEEKQAHIAHAIGGLLSPEPGSMILGTHAALPEKGTRSTLIAIGTDGQSTFNLFAHSPESWTELWDGEVFKKGTVKVATKLIEREGTGGRIVMFLVWSVTRL